MDAVTASQDKVEVLILLALPPFCFGEFSQPIS
jgi:hypothetical protein